MRKLPPSLLRPQQFWSELTEAVKKYEAAWQVCEAAEVHAFDVMKKGGMETLQDQHPAALNYMVATEDLASASDALLPMILRMYAVSVKYKGVIYVVKSASQHDALLYYKGEPYGFQRDEGAPFDRDQHCDDRDKQQSARNSIIRIDLDPDPASLDILYLKD
jgi:hypothetical protein